MPYHRLTRRQLALAGGAAHFPQTLRAASTPGIKLAMGVRLLDDQQLRFVRQLGIEWVAVPSQLEDKPRGLVPASGQAPGGPNGPWDEAHIRHIKTTVESFGLRVGLLSLHAIPNVLLGNSKRDQDIENVHRSLRIAARVGVPVVEYTFMPFRASEGYYVTEGRGGSRLRAFDYDRIRNRPVVPEVGELSSQQVWDRLTYFIKAVVPVAEKEGVRLALHPSDPPVENFRSAAQIARTLDELKRVVDIVPSPANGITFDTGVTREMGGNVVEAIRYFGRRRQINHAHFRNVRVSTPYTAYTETFHDEGEVDLLAAMHAFQEAGYSSLIIPDHVPDLSVDNEWHYAAWAFAVGYMRGLWQAAAKK
jgi:mannonate dehydratase